MIEYDVETTGLQPYSQNNEAFFWIFYDGEKADGIVFYPSIYHMKWNPSNPWDAAIHRYLEEARERIQAWFNRGKQEGIRAWNTKFDRAFADEAGCFDTPGDGCWHDEMLTAHVIDERRSIALKAVASQLFGEDAAAPQKLLKDWLNAENRRRQRVARDNGEEEYVRANYSDVPMSILYPYGIEDAVLTRKVADVHEVTLRNDEQGAEPGDHTLRGTVEFERAAMDALYHIERRGLPARPQEYRRLEQEVIDNLSNLEARVRELAMEGDPVIYGKTLAGDKWGKGQHWIDVSEDGKIRSYEGGVARLEDFKPNSTAQVLAALKARGADMTYMSTKDGKVSADAENLRAVPDELASAILNFRAEYKVLSTYVRPMIGRSYVSSMNIYKEPFVAPDNRIHANYRQVGARTGRMSCSDPNMQNQPRDDLRLRYNIVADEGNVLVACDLSNIEMMLFAAYCGEGRLLSAVRNGEDLHVLTAKMLGLRDRARPGGGIETARQLGKGAPPSTPLLTPQGWSTYGEIQVGDEVVGSNGKPTKVTGVYKRGVLPTSKITFSDGVTAVVDNEHLWAVRTPSQASRQAGWMVKSTEQLSKEVHKEWRIPLVDPVEFDATAKLPFDPYMLGVMLGDGSFRTGYPSFSSIDEEIIDYARSLAARDGLEVKRNGDSVSYRVVGQHKVRNPWKEAFRLLGLDGKYSCTKQVPYQYLTASIADRLALLQGIMDTDGYVVGEVGAGITLTSRALTDDVIELVRSLGGVASTKQRTSYLNGKQHRDAYRTRVRLPSWMSPFRLSRKQTSPYVRTSLQRNICAIEPHTPQDIICISVDAADSLYVSSDYLVTHNTYNFSRIYGGGLRTIRRSFRCSLDEARKLKRRFDDAYPEVSRLQNRIEYRLEDDGFIQDKLISGRRFRVDAKDAYKAPNYLIQGTAAALLKYAVVQLHKDGVPMVALVHDEILAHVPEKDGPEVAKLIQTRMTEFEGLKDVVPLRADADIVTRWSDAKKLKEPLLGPDGQPMLADNGEPLMREFMFTPEWAGGEKRYVDKEAA